MRSSVVSAQTRQRPCRLPARRTPAPLACPARSATVAHRGQNTPEPEPWITADVVIAGGGIVGSAAAYFLSTDAAFRGRRIVLIERDPGYREASTARSAGGIRQQFSTPENIAMSQVTLEMFRRLKTIFGAEADVAFREQGYLIMATPRARRCWPRTWRCSSPWAPTSPCSSRRARRGISLARDGWRGRRRLRPHRRRLVRSHQPRGAVAQGRHAQTASRIVHDRVTAIDVRRPRRKRFARERKQRRLPQPRQRGGAMGRRAVRAGWTATAGRAAQALRLCHRLPRGVRGAASGAADGRSVRRVVPARRARVPVRQIAGGKRGAAGRRPRCTSTTPSSSSRCGRSLPRACRRSRASRSSMPGPATTTTTRSTRTR